MNKETKTIKGYEGLYEIDTYGLVTGRRGYIIPQKNSSGYERVTLSKYGIKKRHFVHRLVLETFTHPSELLVNHKDGVKTNNNLDNLEYTTKSRNFWHADSLGKIKRFFGIDNVNSKKVNMYNYLGNQVSSFDSVGDASRKMGIDSSCISKCCLGKRATAGGFIWKYA